MTLDTCPKAVDISSLEKVGLSCRSDAVIALGRRLVSELALSERGNTLAQWMAHYVAELIDAVGRAGDQKEKAEREAVCFKAILDLWAHRYQLPDGRRPFEQLEPILRALESLDPEGSNLRYFPRSVETVDSSEVPLGAQGWLDAAHNIDRAARLLVSECVSSAAAATEEASKEWLELVEAAGDWSDTPIIRVLLHGEDRTKRRNLEMRNRVIGRLKMLDEFSVAAERLEARLRAQLIDLPDLSDQDDPVSTKVDDIGIPSS